MGKTSGIGLPACHALWRSAIESRGHQVPSVETASNPQIDKPAGKVTHRLEFLEPPAQAIAPPDVSPIER